MWTGVAAGLGAGALWGLVFVAPNVAPQLSAIDLVAGRYFFYGLAAAVAMLLRARRRPLPTLEQGGVALGLSILGFSGYYLLLVIAIRDAGPEVPTLIIGTIPIWVMLLGKPEGLLWRRLLPGIALTVGGVLLMMELPVVGGFMPQDGVGTYWRGIAAALAAMLSWTAFAMLNSAWLKTHRHISTTDWANWLGLGAGVAGVLVWWVWGTPVQVLVGHEDMAQTAMVCIAVGVGSGWLATVLWNRASRALSASLCGQLIVSETLFGLAFAFAWSNTWPSTHQWIAGVFFVLGILASIRAHR